MAISARLLHASLYKEHFEEGSFLYAQRQAYLSDVEVPWPSLHAWEERFEAHLDGLVLGDDLGLDICRQRLAEGDHGELHVALRLYCRRDMKREALDVVAGIDPANADAMHAATSALCAELPGRWRDEVLVDFERHPPLTALYARVIGYRRITAEAALVRRAASRMVDGRAELAWALGRVGTASCVPALASLAADGDDRVREASALAMLRLGDRRVLKAAMASAREQVWAQRVLGIAGGSDAAHLLLEAVQAGRAGRDAVLALGLLGDLVSVMPLFELLDHDDLGEVAAIALNTMTGAQLRGRVFVPYKFDPDDLSEEERKAFDADGTRPARLGAPYGDWEQRPLRDKAGWRAWLEQNKQRFHRKGRWRMGAPHAAPALVDCLRAETTPFAIRSATCDELVVRHALEIPFEADLAVTTQRHLLSRLGQWATGIGAAVERH